MVLAQMREFRRDRDFQRRALIGNYRARKSRDEPRPDTEGMILDRPTPTPVTCIIATRCATKPLIGIGTEANTDPLIVEAQDADGPESPVQGRGQRHPILKTARPELSVARRLVASDQDRVKHTENET